MPATLYIVSTPIGNLEDITLRAIRILKEVAAIAAEDTRHTRVLLARYDIRTPTTSFHEHNEAQKVPALLARLDRGESLALVSDAGTPAISDPGYRLIRAALDAGHRVQAVPGPSAVLGALVSSGFPTDAFTFLGFAPRKPAARREWAARVAAQPHTTVFFETPHRIRQTLEALSQELGDRPICIARELTKIHESSVVQPTSVLLKDVDRIKGEIVVVVPPLTAHHDQAQVPDDNEINNYFCHVTEVEQLSRRGGITRTATKFGLTPNIVYAALERAKKQRRPASA